VPRRRLIRTGRPLAAALLATSLLAACFSNGRADTSASPRLERDATAAAAAGSYPDWPNYHGSRLRAGVATTMPRFTGHLAVTQRLALDGNVLGSPIVVGGRVIVATENDSVYAFGLGGRQLWKRHLGAPAQQSELPCGDIFPLGITGTPAYNDGLVYVAPEYGSPVRHEVVALRVGTGSVAWHRGLDFPGVDHKAMQQRGALTVAGGRVWVPFGGLAGDCGAYKGRVIGMPLDGTGTRSQFTVPTDREAGIWTPPGPTVDRYGWLYVAVGNGAGRNGGYDYSDSVIKIGSAGRMRDSFSPASWKSDNDADLDLGSQGPAIVQGKWIFQAGKSGTAYVLRRDHLGGIGGQVSSKTVCRSFGGTAVQDANVWVPCSDGVRKVTISPTGQITVGWHASPVGSPVVGAGRVWVVDRNNGTLYALNKSTGAQNASVSVGSVGHFPTPALYGPYVIVPTLAGVTIVKES
jgi:outer membrane protein assembly factor BamB